MKGRKGNQLLMILFIINFIIVLVGTYAVSKFEGNNNGGIPCNIQFNVKVFGRWSEHRIYYDDYTEFYFTGTADDIGSFNKSIIAFLILSQIFCLVGSAFSAVILRRISSFGTEENQNKVKVGKLVGSVILLLGGIFGLIKMILFAVFKSTIIQPFDALGWFNPNNTPEIQFGYGFIVSTIIYCLFIVLCMISLVDVTVNLIKKQKQEQQVITMEETNKEKEIII